MYKYIFKNKLIFLSIAAAIVIYTLLKCKKKPIQEKIITMEPVEPSTQVKTKVLDTEVITEQLAQSLDQDNANFLIDNEILNGKIELPEVAYTDPAIADLLVPIINEKNDGDLAKYMKGSVVFNETLPSHKDCYKYTCMPGSYKQCTNNIYSNSNKDCECKVIDACRTV